MSSLGTRWRAHTAIPLYRSAYALMSSVVATSALGFLFWAIASRTYSTEAVGVASATLAALTFLTGIGGLYLDGALYRFLPRAGEATNPLLVWTALVTVGSATAAAVAFLAGLHVWAPDLSFLRSGLWIAVVAVLSVVGSCLLVLTDGAFIGLRRAGWVPLKGIAYGLAKIAVLIICIPLVPRYGIVVAWVAPIALILLASLGLLTRRLLPERHGADDEELSAALVTRYAAGNYLAFLCNLAYRTLPPLLVIHELGARSNAYFYIPWLIATSVILLSNNLSVSLVVEGSLDPSELRIQTRRALLQFIRVLLPMSIVLVVAAPLILRIFGSGYAEHGTSLLRLLAAGLVPGSIAIIAIGVARVQNHVAVIIAAQLGLAIVILGLGIVFLRVLGLEGLGLSWLIGQSVAAAALTWRELRPTLRVPERPRRPRLADHRLELLEEEVERMEREIRERLGRLDYGGGGS